MLIWILNDRIKIFAAIDIFVTSHVENIVCNLQNDNSPKLINPDQKYFVIELYVNYCSVESGIVT